MTKARCDKLEQCAWVAKAHKCRFKPAVTDAPSHVPTQSPTITPVVYPCSFFKHVVGCCGAKYASGQSTACVNANVSPVNSCRVGFALLLRALTPHCSACNAVECQSASLPWLTFFRVGCVIQSFSFQLWCAAARSGVRCDQRADASFP